MLTAFVILSISAAAGGVVGWFAASRIGPWFAGVLCVLLLGASALLVAVARTAEAFVGIGYVIIAMIVPFAAAAGIGVSLLLTVALKWRAKP
ncbi:MAG: hypothetical protein ACXIU8_13165 [Alkalilacustris sp.]